jgi:hypothetical protein
MSISNDHVLAERADLRDDRRPRALLWLGPGWARRDIPSTSRRATTRCPGGKLGKLDWQWEGMLPQDTAWSGCARPTGCHTSPSMQDRQGTTTSDMESGARACIGCDWPWTAGHSRTAPDTRRSAVDRFSAGQGRLLRGGSRIRTLEGISRRIYSPLPCGQAAPGCRRDPTSRALRVPFMGSTSGHSRLTLAAETAA